MWLLGTVALGSLEPRSDAAADDWRTKSSPSRRLGTLDVLSLMAEGLTNNGIASRLFLSARTVEAHVGNLMTKLDITDSDERHRWVLAVLSYLRATH